LLASTSLTCKFTCRDALNRVYIKLLEFGHDLRTLPLLCASRNSPGVNSVGFTS
jgi:hypothetical protein